MLGASDQQASLILWLHQQVLQAVGSPSMSGTGPADGMLQHGVNQKHIIITGLMPE